MSQKAVWPRSIGKRQVSGIDLSVFSPEKHLAMSRGTGGQHSEEQGVTEHPTMLGASLFSPTKNYPTQIINSVKTEKLPKRGIWLLIQKHIHIYILFLLLQHFFKNQCLITNDLSYMPAIQSVALVPPKPKELVSPISLFSVFHSCAFSGT